MQRNLLMEDTKKILIIEDDSDISEIYETWFEGKGYTVVKSSTGLDGASNLLKERFSLVIVDIKLPYKSGVDVVKFLRRSEYSNEETRALIISGFVNDIEEVEKLREVYVLEKPAREEDIFEILNK